MTKQQSKIHPILQFRTSMHPSINVLGGPLAECSTKPLTGWFRDGCCNTDNSDLGRHVVCCIVTDVFLQFARSKGNDLMTPAPQFGFPGLEAGDRWCVCAETWVAAFEEGAACPVDLEATHESALQIITLEQLELHAL